MLGRSGLGLVSERDFFRVLSTVSSSSLLVMSSDPFADLASSTEAFAREFREFMTRNPRPASGSPADKEAQGEPFAGDWSEHPSSDIFATTYLTATSCTDHLLGLADVLRARNASHPRIPTARVQTWARIGRINVPKEGNAAGTTD